MINPDTAEIFIKENLCPYVSRGGLKLEKSMSEFSLNLQNTVCMDIGASTGGFTDCMLQNGAEKVYAIDVGYGQLEDGEIVCLVKPQFEAGREQVGKKGIVRDGSVHKEVIENVIRYGEENGLYPHGLTFSPVTGAKGNIEYLLYLSKYKEPCYNVSCIQEVVENSHKELE